MTPDPNAIRVLTPAELEPAVQVQARAFLTDPLWVYLIPDDRQREKLLAPFFRPVFRYAIRAQQGYGVSNPLEGVAIWSAPEQNSKFFGLATFRLFFTPLLLPVLRAIPVVSRFDRMQKIYAPEPHFYLNTISVLPQAQGKGLASKLIRPFLKQADERQVGTYTETMTPSNVPLYEHFGFRCMERDDIPNTSLSIWALYRPPQK